MTITTIILAILIAWGLCGAITLILATYTDAQRPDLMDIAIVFIGGPIILIMFISDLMKGNIVIKRSSK